MSVQVAGQLEALGFDEIEPGIVEDSTLNRRRLMALTTDEGAWAWERVVAEDGSSTGLIRAISPELRSIRREEVAERRAPILSDPKDPWSDYVHPDEYPLDIDLPYWVEMRLRKWREDEAAGIPESDRRRFPTRCVQLRTDNTRCWLWVNKPDESPRCSKHLGITSEAVERNPAYARMRVLEASTDAVDNLVYLMHYADGEAVRLKASTEILDRAGVSGKTDVDINLNVSQADPSEALAERLRDLAKRNAAAVTQEPDTLETPQLEQAPADEIIEVEIIEEEAESA